MEVELLEFLLRLAEVLLVPVDDTLSLALSPVFREELVQTVWRESFALRYSLFDMLVHAVAAAQLAPIASCTDVKSPDRVPVIPPPDVLVLSWCGLLLRLRLCLLDPVGDDLSFLFPGRLTDLLDKRVFSFAVSVSDCSVTVVFYLEHILPCLFTCDMYACYACFPSLSIYVSLNSTPNVCVSY